MGASAYVGRVGRLAVALGVGTAVFTGHGIATAEETDGPSPNPPASEPAENPADAAPTAPVERPAAGVPAENPSDPGDPKPEGTVGEEAQPGVVRAQTNTGNIGETPTETTQPETEPQPKPEPEPELEPAPAPSPATPDIPPASTPKSEDVAADNSNTAPPAPAAPRGSSSSPAAGITTYRTTTVEKTTYTLSGPPTAATALSADTTMPVAGTGVGLKDSDRRAALTSAVNTVSTPQAPNPFSMVADFVASVVNMVLAPLVGSGPAAPANAPTAWTLLAYARREIENFVNAVTGQSTAARTAAAEPMSLALAATTVANVPNFPLAGAQLSPSTSFVNWVTGDYQVLGTDGKVNPYLADTLNRFGVSGTDVGVMWDNGIEDDLTTDYNEHQVLIAFGDTFGLRSVPGEDWRFNSLMRSADTYLADGMEVPDGEFGNGNWFGGTPLWDVPPNRDYLNYARRIIHPEELPSGAKPGITLIPTAGVALPSTDPDAIGGMTQYVSFMSVTQWGSAGRWTTNFSGIAYSIDNGENWKIAPSSIRYNDPYSGNANFQQSAFVRGDDGYVYAYGTPNGRQGAAYLSRVLEKDILDISKYEYYNKGSAGGLFGIGATKAGWYKNQPAKATAVFGASEQGACGAVKPGVQVSEMSVQYNKQLKKYVVLYGDQSNNIVMRTSDTPQGTWSAAKVLMSQQPGGIYAPMMHPWSPSTLGTGSDLYWNLSIWSEYNVMLMKTDLAKA